MSLIPAPTRAKYAKRLVGTGRSGPLFRSPTSTTLAGAEPIGPVAASSSWACCSRSAGWNASRWEFTKRKERLFTVSAACPAGMNHVSTSR